MGNAGKVYMKDTGTVDQNKLNATADDRFIFGTVFIIANRLQTLMDREFEQYDMTAKQWFLSIVIDSLFDSPPTLNDVANVIGNTHQNVKQVALKLQSKGFLEIKDDEYDGRAVRLALTDKSHEFWAGMQQSSEQFLADVYKGLTDEEMSTLRQGLGKIWSNIEDISKKNDRRIKS
jgi:MarR family transcriptional regulator, transcriptional regulator for hemolysin